MNNKLIFLNDIKTQLDFADVLTTTFKNTTIRIVRKNNLSIMRYWNDH